MLRLIFLVNPTPSESSQTPTSGSVQQGASKKNVTERGRPGVGEWIKQEQLDGVAAVVSAGSRCSETSHHLLLLPCLPHQGFMGQDKLFLPGHTNKKSDYSLGCTADFQEKEEKAIVISFSSAGKSHRQPLLLTITGYCPCSWLPFRT